MMENRSSAHCIDLAQQSPLIIDESYVQIYISVKIKSDYNSFLHIFIFIHNKSDMCVCSVSVTVYLSSIIFQIPG